MPPRPKPILDKDLCVYLIEVDSTTGVVSDEVIQLVRQCVSDKIFGENQDHIAVCRSDGSSSVVFREANWETLRKVEEGCRIQKESNSDGGKKKTFSFVRDIVEYMDVQFQEDTYKNKKLLIFGKLTEIIPEDEMRALADTLVSNKIATSFILPDLDKRTDAQTSNYDNLSNVVQDEKYVRVEGDDLLHVTTLREARRQVSNTLSKKPVRPSPWNVEMEISSQISISVAGYVCVRKNKSADIKKALMKDIKIPAHSESNNNATSTNDMALTSVAGTGTGSTENNAANVELASEVTGKETFWKQKDGTIVDEEDIGKGYYYGDQVIPFNEIESVDAYKSGCKCLKVLLFCPRENILPQYLQGDGTTLFYPKTGDGASGVKLEALIKALDQTDRVAVVRKVYRLDTKPVLGVLAPDTFRKCLVFTELCYADDVSIPHFPTLMKPINEDESITTKEELIDSLISSFSLEDFDPSSGPVDPAITLLRGSIASKLLDTSPGLPTIQNQEDSLRLFFEQFQKTASEELVQKLTSSFPLAIKQEVGEKASGSNIFRKRVRDGEEVKSEGEKKVKVEQLEESLIEDIHAAKLDEPDYDDLLDDL